MKVICVGRNYADHATELKNEIPTEPVLFMKPKNAVLVPEKPFYYPEFTDDLHYECEVVVKINKNGKFIGERHALKYFTEISLGIDFTARDLQREQQRKGLPWEIAKAFDDSAAIGYFNPLPADWDINNLSFELRKNGEMVQEGNTKDMIFKISKIISYASKFFTLNIGDLVFTGTPAGVGQVNVHDVLEGFLMGEKVLEVNVM
ncbi:MAG: FAA hydrolase family protein [Chitinophagia bacterium]|nr:FAA hydrolase family protein [Chitinophagia bacterium]